MMNSLHQDAPSREDRQALIWYGDEKAALELRIPDD
jgi:hypothetical protein